MVVLTSGVPWLSPSTPLKPLTDSSYSCPPPAAFSFSHQPTVAVATVEAKTPPPHPILAEGKQRRAKGSIFLSPLPDQFTTKAARVSLTLPPLHLLSPQLAQGMESIISLCWLPES